MAVVRIGGNKMSVDILFGSIGEFPQGYIVVWLDSHSSLVKMGGSFIDGN
jgi:hypothetical protein